MATEKYRDETIEGIETFNERIKEIVAGKPKGDIIVYFSGSIDPATGVTWCPDCRKLEPIFTKVKGKIRDGSVLLHVLVGSQDAWKQKDNPFRTDKKLKLTGVPTIIIWNTPKRLMAPQAFQESVLALLFEED